MSRWPALILFFAAVFAVSLLGTVAGRHVGRRPAVISPPVTGHLGNEEPWLHKQLNLTPEQKAALRAEQANFESEEVRLERLMAEAQDDLSRLIRKDQEMTPDVKECLGRINSYHGELQRATLEHLFATYEKLDDPRRTVLLDLTSTALRDPLEKFNSQAAAPGATNH